MAFQINFVFLEPREVQLLAASTALELSDNIFLIIAYNPA